MYIGQEFTTSTTTVNHSSNAPSFAGITLDLQVAKKWDMVASPQIHGRSSSLFSHIFNNVENRDIVASTSTTRRTLTLVHNKQRRIDNKFKHQDEFHDN